MLAGAPVQEKTNQPLILVVEDTPISARVAQLALGKLDCLVEIAETGSAAIDQWAKQSYDLIFMDVGLPDISGIQVVKQIRAMESAMDCERVPIIGLTAHNAHRDACMSAGMDEFASKPLDLRKAKDILSRFCRSNQKVAEQ